MTAPMTATTAPVTANAATATCGSEAAFSALSQTLHGLRDVLELITDDGYRRRPVATFDGSIGGHVRHCLDHVLALLDGLGGKLVDYDRRQRGTPIECDRGIAIEALREADVRLRRAVHTPLNCEMRVSILMAENGPFLETISSVGRELAFVLNHTIHHNAMIAAMAASLGVLTPPRFGFAPATLAHLDCS